MSFPQADKKDLKSSDIITKSESKQEFVGGACRSAVNQETGEMVSLTKYIFASGSVFIGLWCVN